MMIFHKKFNLQSPRYDDIVINCDRLTETKD